MWIHATRLRDPGRVKPMIASRDPPLNKVTSRTRKRLCRGNKIMTRAAIALVIYFSIRCRVSVVRRTARLQIW